MQSTVFFGFFLQMQMVALLQMSSSRADSYHVTQLQSKLSEARCDIQVLTEQLQQREQTGVRVTRDKQDKGNKVCIITYKQR